MCMISSYVNIRVSRFYNNQLFIAVIIATVHKKILCLKSINSIYKTSFPQNSKNFFKKTEDAVIDKIICFIFD